jgi:hypothetical protein
LPTKGTKGTKKSRTNTRKLDAGRGIFYVFIFFSSFVSFVGNRFVPLVGQPTGNGRFLHAYFQPAPSAVAAWRRDGGGEPIDEGKYI